MGINQIQIFKGDAYAYVFKTSLENTIFFVIILSHLPHSSGSVKVRHTVSQSSLPCHARDLRPLY